MITSSLLSDFWCKIGSARLEKLESDEWDSYSVITYLHIDKSNPPHHNYRYFDTEASAIKEYSTFVKYLLNELES